MKVVHGTNKHELKLNITALNGECQSYKYDWGWGMWWTSTWFKIRIFVVSTAIRWGVTFTIYVKF